MTTAELIELYQIVFEAGDRNGIPVETIGNMAKEQRMISIQGEAYNVTEICYPYFLCQMNILHSTCAEIMVAITYLEDGQERSQWENRFQNFPLKDKDREQIINWVGSSIERMKSKVLARKPKGRAKLTSGTLMLED